MKGRRKEEEKILESMKLSEWKCHEWLKVRSRACPGLYKSQTSIKRKGKKSNIIFQRTREHWKKRHKGRKHEEKEKMEEGKGTENTIKCAPKCKNTVYIS